MTWRRLALRCCAPAAVALAGPTHAGVWGIDPVLGIAADYSSNPSLVPTDYAAELHAALLLDAPATYTGNAFKITVLPSFRFSDSAGYSSLASNYQRLSLSGEWDNDRGSLTASAGVSRDSSLYHDYLFSGSLGVRRETSTADLTWDRLLTERVETTLALDSQRLRYGRSDGSIVLTDYDYSSAAPTLSWRASENTKISLSGSLGLYKASDGATKSVNASAQAGFTRQLTALWSVSATAGLSRETDTFRAFFGDIQSTKTGSVYKGSVVRQARVFSLTASASRQLTPSGLAFLSRQDAYELSGTYSYSDRLSFTGNARRVRAENPQFSGATIDQTYSVGSFSTSWRWTEKWTVIAIASYIKAVYPQSDIGVDATGITLQVSRKFNRIAVP